MHHILSAICSFLIGYYIDSRGCQTGVLVRKKKGSIVMKNITSYGASTYGVDKVLDALEYTVNAKISPWEITFGEDGMPILAVERIRNGESQIGFLTPFRCYRFQVSATIDGQWDLGSSDVATDMYQLAYMGELGYKCLRALCDTALNKFGTHVGIKDMATYDAFLCLCADYLRKRTDHIKQCYHIA